VGGGPGRALGTAGLRSASAAEVGKQPSPGVGVFGVACSRRPREIHEAVADWFTGSGRPSSPVVCAGNPGLCRKGAISRRFAFGHPDLRTLPYKPLIRATPSATPKANEPAVSRTPYPRPPITEAVIDLRFAGNVEAGQLIEALERALGDQVGGPR
jgi:hypothetical protein